MAVEDFANRAHQLRILDGELRLGLLQLAVLIVTMVSSTSRILNSASVQASKFLTVLHHRFRSRFTFASITSQIMGGNVGSAELRPPA